MNTPYAGNQFPPRENETNACDEAFVSSPFLRAQNRNRNPVAPTERGRHSVCLHTNSIKKNRWTQMLIMKKILLTLAILTVAGVGANAQLNVGVTGTNYVIDFDSTFSGVSNGQFAGAGFQSAPTAGQLDSDAWAGTGMSDGAFAFGGTATIGDWARGAVSTPQSTGGLYSYGTTNRQLMIQPIGADFAPGTLTLRIQNTTGSTVTSWALGYDLWVNNDQGRSNSFNLSYSTDNSSFSIIGLTGVSAYTSIAAADLLGWHNVGTAADSVSATVANNGFLYMRWSGADVGGSGSRDEFGLDNVSVRAIPEPVTCALFGAGALLWVLRRKRTA